MQPWPTSDVVRANEGYEVDAGSLTSRTISKKKHWLSGLVCFQGLKMGALGRVELPTNGSLICGSLLFSTT